MSERALLCFGHRGAMGHAPENTLASIRKALELGVDWIEIDVYQVDGHLLVFHDDRLERMTDGRGYLQDHSFAELRRLRVTGSTETIPTLQEVCTLINGRVGLNIELKGPGTAQPVSMFTSQLLQTGWSLDKLLISSFNHRELQQLQRLRPQLRRGALHCSLPVDHARFAADLGAYSLHSALEFVDEMLVADAHARGLQVYVYTVDHPKDIARMQAMGVDGVFSNYPERVLALR
ncbi:MAG: glycerophosphodiester phosphodiesterase family protein [Thiolinea sp.]